MAASAKCLLAATLFFSCCGIGNCQTNPESYLQARGYAITIDGLSSALQDSRPGVRAGAASLLGQKDYTDALPALESGLAHETNQDVALAMATSAYVLGWQEARARVAGFCSAKDESLQSIAASFLQSHGDDECIGEMILLLASPSAGTRESSLLYLSHVSSLSSPAPSSLGPALLHVVQTDSYPYNVDLAIGIIRKIGDAQTKAALNQIKRSAK